MNGGNLGIAVQMLKIMNQQGGSQSWEDYLYDQSDLVLWSKDRSGYEFEDELGNNHQILLPYLTCNGTDDLARSLAINAASFVSKVSGTYCEAVVKVIDGEINYFFSLSQSGHAYKRMFFQITADRLLRYYIRDGTYERSIVSATALTEGWHTVKIESSGGKYYFYVDSVAVGISVLTGLDDGQWGVAAVAPSVITIGADIVSGGTTYYPANVANIKFGDTMQWVCNNSLRIICLGYAETPSGDGQSSYSLYTAGTGTKKAYGSIDTYTLDKGYSVYKKAGSPDIEVPNLTDGSECNAIITGYAEDSVVNGNLTYHNLADSKIRFTADFFDRSNATIWKDECRASDYYDAGNVKDFHISEINFKTLIGWLNTGYAGKFYPKVQVNSINDRKLLKELILYDTDKTGDNEVKILKYTGDIAEAVTDESGNYVYDDITNYVLIAD